MVYFISDLHLGYFEGEKEKKREGLFLSFLDYIATEGNSLVIVGDLFDYWFDYKFVIPKKFYRIVSKLAEIKSKGTEIIYLMGNHDFGHYKFFQEELGIEIHTEDLELILNGKKFFISHGDGKITNDKGYLILKKLLRNRSIQKLFRLLHPDLGLWLAISSSRKSRNYTTKREKKDFNSLFEFAKKKIEEGFDFVIMGHSHKSEYKEYLDKIYINLGDWFTTPLCACFDGSKIELIEIKKLIINN